MSYTIVDDDGIIQIRASITTAKDMRVLIDKLQERCEKLDTQEINEEKSDE